MKSKWVKILAGGVAAVVVVCGGVFTAMYQKTVSSETFLNALKYIESGAIPAENPDFAQKADLMASGTPIGVSTGIYKHLSQHNGITYDTVLVLKDNSAYEFAMNVGNGAMHKTYQHSGRWWVEGQVFKTILVEGDLFLASPLARDRATAMREIIINADGDELVLLAHYNKEPVTFKRVESVEK